MKINIVLLYILFTIILLNTNSFIIKNLIFNKKFVNKKIFNNNINLIDIPNNIKIIDNQIYKIKNNEYFKLIRGNNIIPVIFICIITNIISYSSFKYIITINNFISILITILLMSSSMIINDIWDIPIDKINNPYRPLITGKIKINNAIGLTTIMLFFSYILSKKFLTIYSHYIINLIIFLINLYTPFFKKITWIKNITCAGIVGCLINFIGYSSPNIKSNNLINILSILLFFGSFYTEILLDIIDYDGDKLNNIKTIPVKYGKQKSLIISNYILLLAFGIPFIMITYYYHIIFGLLFFLIFTPLYNNYFFINKSNFNLIVIKEIIAKSSLYLYLSFIYFAIISLITNYSLPNKFFYHFL